MSTVRDIESVVAIAMVQANFKVVTVPIHNAHGTHFFALYHLKQGRQAGRKTDFAGCHRLGGFFVEESVPPASGVLVFVDSIGTFDCRHIGMYIDGMVWGAGAIQQILATDGDTWLSFIRDEDGQYYLREEFTEPRARNDDQNSDALGRHIWEHAVFQEKLHRALLPWKDIVNPAVLAAFTNSSIMSLCWDMEENSSMSLVDDFTASLENELGVRIQEQKQNSRESTRLLLASVSVLERIGAVLAHKLRLPVKTTLPAGLVQCVERIQSRNIKSTIDPVDIIAEHLAKDYSPQRITEFCRVFWNTLPNGGVAWDTVSSLSDEVIDSHIDFLRSRLAAEEPQFGGTGSNSMSWLDPHAGTGNLFVRALYTGRNEPGILRTATAIEPSPLKFFLLQLRVMAALVDVAQTGKTPKSVRLLLANLIVKPEIMAEIPDNSLCVLGSDLRIFGEKHVLFAGNPDLTAKFKTTIRNEWGMSAFDEEDGFTQYAALIDVFLQNRRHAAALLFVPRAWLDSDTLAAARMAWGEDADRMYVTALPVDPAPTKQTRKIGLVSAILLHSSAGSSLDAYGLDILPGDDVSTVMATDGSYQPLTPTKGNHFSLSPVCSSVGYLEWPSLIDLTLVSPFNGPAERCGMALMDNDPGKLEERMRDYFSPMSDAELRSTHPALMPGAGRGRGGEDIRENLLRHFRFDGSRIVPYPIRPFDHWWVYLENLRPLFKEPSPELQELGEIPGNAFLLVREPNERAVSGLAAWFSPHICDYDFFAGNSRQFPLYVDATMTENKKAKRRRGAQKLLTNLDPIPNLSPCAMGYLEHIAHDIQRYENESLTGKTESLPAAGHDSPNPGNQDRVLWFYILAVLYTPAYNHENVEALRRDWPRIPIPYWSHPEEIRYPASLLRAFSDAGRQIAQLLSMHPLSHGNWPTLPRIAVLAGKDGWIGENPNLRVANSWAIRTKVNAVRPGKGDARMRACSDKERDELRDVLEMFDAAGAEPEPIFGGETVDVYLNDDIYWRGVPETVWEFELGGHKVLRKWLSYRAESIIKRQLTLDECGIFTDIARRVALIIALGVRLDNLWPRLKEEAAR